MAKAAAKILPQGQGQSSENQAYCVKCRQKTPMKDAQAVTMKNGRQATKGSCAQCSTSVFKIESTKK